MAKFIDQYYYHLTTEYILPFIRKGGFTTQYHRTKSFEANPEGAFIKNKNEKIGDKTKELRRSLIQKMCAINYQFDLDSKTWGDPEISVLAKNIVKKLDENIYEFRELKDYPSWHEILIDASIKFGDSNEARIKFDNYISKRLEKIFNHKPFDKTINKSQFMKFKKLLGTELNKYNSEAFDFISNHWCELWYKAEEYVCVTHSYFFNLGGVLNNLNTYLGHLNSKESVVLLRIKNSIASFKEDWSQNDAFISSDIISPHHIAISKITDATIMSQLILRIKQYKNNEEAFGIGEEVNIEKYALEGKSDKVIANDFSKFIKSFEPFPEHSQGYLDKETLEWI